MQHCVAHATCRPRFSSGGTAAPEQSSKLPQPAPCPPGMETRNHISRSEICQPRCHLALIWKEDRVWSKDTHLSVRTCKSLTRRAATGTVSGTLPPGPTGTLRGSRSSPCSPAPALGSVLELVCQPRCHLALIWEEERVWSEDTHLSVRVCQSLTHGAAARTVSGTFPPGPTGTLRGSRTQQPLLACPGPGLRLGTGLL